MINRVTILSVIRYRLHKLVFEAVGATQIEQLNAGPTQFDQDLKARFVTGRLVFTRLNETVMLEGEFDTEVTVQCVRSLEDFQLCRTITLEETFFTLPNLVAEDPTRQIDSDGWVDVTDTLREEILMSIPINPINPAYSGVDNGALPEGFTEEDREWLNIKWQNRESDNEQSLAGHGSDD